MEEELKVTPLSPLEMEYGRGSRTLTLKGVEASGRRVSVHLDAASTWVLWSGLNAIAQVQGPPGEEPGQRSVQ